MVAAYARALQAEVIAPVQGATPLNPAEGIRLPRRAAVERFLSNAEATALMAALDAAQEAKAIDASRADIFRLLLLTGARRTEISGLWWSEVDLPRNRLTLPPERSKAGGRTGERRIALGEAARAILAKRQKVRAKGAVFVFPALDGSEGHTVGLQKAWARVRKRAGLPGLRLHDLRRTYASFAIADGASLYLVGKALAHSSSRVTERYAHIRGDAWTNSPRPLGGGSWTREARRAMENRRPDSGLRRLCHRRVGSRSPAETIEHLLRLQELEDAAGRTFEDLVEGPANDVAFAARVVADVHRVLARARASSRAQGLRDLAVAHDGAGSSVFRSAVVLQSSVCWTGG